MYVVVFSLGDMFGDLDIRQNQKTPGTRRQRTLVQYSVYPGKFLERNRSSSNSRHIKKGHHGCKRK
jgi:hypothetical protein